MNIPENELVSFCFMDSSGRVVDSRNSKIPFIPASNMKVVTSFLAALRFGLDHDFVTNMGIEGDSIILSGGPMFYVNLNDMINDLLKSRETRNNKLSRINKIVFADQALDDEFYNPTWEIGDSRHSYQPPISSYFTHENCTSVGRADFVENFTVLDHHNEESYKPVRDPYRNIAKSVKAALNLSRTPQIIRSSNDNAKSYVNYKVSMDKVLSHILKESCNFYAEVLFKFISSEQGKQGSWIRSSEMARKSLSGITNSALTRFVDGSGLSKDNLLNVVFLADLFRLSKIKFGERFLNLFPAPGEGTLRKRLSGFEKFHIRAKTGTLASVSAISGVIMDQDISFSISINNSLRSTREREYIIDSILGEFIMSGHVSAETI